MSKISFINIIISKLLLNLFKILRKIHFPKYIVNLFYKNHVNYVKYLLAPYFIQSCKYINSNNRYKGTKNSLIIWIFWWQGYSKMPLIVKRCIQSIKDNSNGHKLILLTKKNIKNYIYLPEIIYKKVNSNKLDLTHFSDIIRFNLLDRYGGLWVDSTMYCTSKIDDDYFNYLYTSGGYQNTLPKFVNGRWAEFLIGGNSGNNVLRFVDKFLQLYFSNNNKLPSYFLADYALDYSYNHNLGNFKNYINDQACKNNPELFKLVNLLNSQYNKNEFRYITKDTNMFKLTYKKKFNNNLDTFYNRLMIQRKRNRWL